MTESIYDQALKLFTAASDAEDAGDVGSAIKLYKLSAKLGFSPALINLGNWYDDHSNPREPRKAIALYKRAVALGDEAAAYCLAIHYRNLGQKRWYMYWLKRSAKMGYEDAIVKIQQLGEARGERLVE